MLADKAELSVTCDESETEMDNDASDSLLFTPSPMSPFLCNIANEVKLPEMQELKFYCSDDTSEEELQNDIEQWSNFYNDVSNNDLDASFGDTSEENSTTPTSNSDVDPGLPRNDFLDFEKCRLCQTDKKNINYPYCPTCFKRKKILNPRKPIMQNKRVKITDKYFEFQNVTCTLSGIKNDKTKNIVLKKENAYGNSDIKTGNVGSQHSEDIAGVYLQPSTSNSCSTVNHSHLKNPEGCRVCFSKPESGLFVHAKTAHLYGCYNCAQEIWYQSGACPICRSKVFKVIKLYI